MVFVSVSRSLLHLFIFLAITASNKRSKQKMISTWATINRDFLQSETKDGAQTSKRFFRNDPGNPPPPRGSSNPGYPVKIYPLHPPLGTRGSDNSEITPHTHILTLLCWRAFDDRCFEMKAECEESKAPRCLTRFTVMGGGGLLFNTEETLLTLRLGCF